jgi:hypothetical protein
MIVTNLNGIRGEVKALLDNSGQLANAAALLAKNILCAGGEDDDLGALRGRADLDTRVAERNVI